MRKNVYKLVCFILIFLGAGLILYGAREKSFVEEKREDVQEVKNKIEQVIENKIVKAKKFLKSAKSNIQGPGKQIKGYFIKKVNVAKEYATDKIIGPGKKVIYENYPFLKFLDKDELYHEILKLTSSATSIRESILDNLVRYLGRTFKKIKYIHDNINFMPFISVIAGVSVSAGVYFFMKRLLR